MRTRIGEPDAVIVTGVGPPLLSPQHFTSPSARAAQLACLATEIATAFVIPEIAVGVFCPPPAPFTCPPPVHWTVPLANKKQL